MLFPPFKVTLLSRRNARAEAYFGLADRCRMGHMQLPDNDLLREELAFARYDVGSSPPKFVPRQQTATLTEPLGRDLDALLGTSGTGSALFAA